MANGSNLNFSVIFSAVTQAFNAGVKGAAKTYQDATNGNKGSSDQIDAAADKAVANPPLTCEGVGAAMKSLGESCKACHQDFRG